METLGGVVESTRHLTVIPAILFHQMKNTGGGVVESTRHLTVIPAILFHQMKNTRGGVLESTRHLTVIPAILFHQMKDTRGEVVESTRHLTDFLQSGVHGFIGPEHTCHVEATIAAARNLSMISYVRLHILASTRYPT